MKETQDVFHAMATLVLSFLEAAKDGGSAFSKLRHFMDDGDEVLAALKGIESVPVELLAAAQDPEKSAELIKGLHVEILRIIEKRTQA